MPEYTPDWRDSLKDEFSLLPDNFLNNLSGLGPVQDWLNKVNIESYLPWDELKGSPLPQDFSPALAWAYAKVKRTASARPLPFVGMNGRPFTYNLPDPVSRGFHAFDRAPAA